MLSTASLAETASLIGDLARASMLAALMDGRALTAAELAQLAGISPQTASGHLAKLTQAGLLSMEKQGRHRYHRLASPSSADSKKPKAPVPGAHRLANSGSKQATMRPTGVLPRQATNRRTERPTSEGLWPGSQRRRSSRRSGAGHRRR